MKENSPDCYGKFEAGKKACVKCVYNKSCAYCKATENMVESRSRLASFEQIENWKRDVADYDHIPGTSRPESNDILTVLSRFFRYILDLDDYSLGIIREVIAPTENGTPCTVSQLGRLHGCSRQAMHRKLLDMIAKHPELALLFREIMFKLPRARRIFLRNRAATAACGAEI